MRAAAGVGTSLLNNPQTFQHLRGSTTSKSPAPIFFLSAVSCAEANGYSVGKRGNPISIESCLVARPLGALYSERPGENPSIVCETMSAARRETTPKQCPGWHLGVFKQQGGAAERPVPPYSPMGHSSPPAKPPSSGERGHGRACVFFRRDTHGTKVPQNETYLNSSYCLPNR